MEYNKRQYSKTNNKKVLHKVKKNWVVMSMALLSAIGGGAVLTHATAHADANTGNQNATSQSQTATVTPKVKLATNTTVQSNNSASNSNQSTRQTVANPNTIMHQATNMYQHVLLNAAHNNAKQTTSHNYRLLGSANGRQSNVSQSKNSAVQSDNAQAQYSHQQIIDNTKTPKLNKKLGVNGTGKITINWIEPSDNNRTVTRAKVVSDLDGTLFNYKNFLSTVPVGYEGQKVDTRYSIPTKYTDANQSLYIDVSKIKAPAIGYAAICYVDVGKHDQMENQIPLVNSNTTMLQYSDVLSDMQTAPTGYKIVHETDADPKKGIYLGNVDPHDFPLQYSEAPNVTRVYVDVVPTNTSNQPTQPLFVNYINQHGQNVNTPSDYDPINAAYGTKLNVTMPPDGNPVPAGYYIAPGENVDYTINSDRQNVNIVVVGNPMSTANVLVKDVTKDGKTLASKNVAVSGKIVGDSYEIDPNNETISGYYADPSNKPFVGKILPPDSSDNQPHLSNPTVSFLYDQDTNQQQPGSINFNFINQNGQNVNTPSDNRSVDGSIGSNVKPNSAPSGYTINSDEAGKSYPIDNHPQNIPVFVHGNKITYPVTIHRYEQIIGPNGLPTGAPKTQLKDMTDNVTGQIGNTTPIPSSDFEPKGDDSANSDFVDNEVLFTPTGLNPSSVTFTYNKSYENDSNDDHPMQRESENDQIVLQDQDNSDKQVGSPISISDILGRPVKYSKYMSDIKQQLPNTDYLVAPKYPNAVFAVNSNGSGVYPYMVGEYGYVKVRFVTPSDTQIKSDSFKAPLNKPFSVSDIKNDVTAFLNSHPKDMVSSDSPYDPSKDPAIVATKNKKTNNTQTVSIKVEPKQHTVNTTVVYEDQTSDYKPVKTVNISGTSGTSINYKPYQQNIPGFKYESMDKSDATTYQSDKSAPKQKHIIYVGKLVSTKVVYKDASNNVISSDTINDVRGTNTQNYYDQYAANPPKGYVLAENVPNKWNSTVKNWDPTLKDGDTDVIYVAKMSPKVRSSKITFENEFDNNNDVEQATLTGKPSDLIAMNSTKSDNGYLNNLPDNFVYDSNNPSNSNIKSKKYGSDGVVYIMPKTVTGTVVIENKDKKDAHVGQFTVSGAPYSKINLGQNTYTNNLPSDYSYDTATPEVNFSLSDFKADNGTYPMLVDQKPATIHIKYENQSDNDNVVHTSDVKGLAGDPVNYNYYSNNIPTGYKYARKGYQDPKFKQSDTDVILVSPKQMSVNLIYEDDTNNKDNQVASKTISVPYDTTVTPAQYMNKSDIPTGYQFDKASTQKPIKANGTDDVIYVKSSSKPTATAELTFEDADNNDKVIAKKQISGTAGTPIVYSDYMNLIPTGYNYYKMGHHDSDYTNGDNNIILVTETGNTHSNSNISDVTANILYEDIDHNYKVVRSTPVKGIPGTKINYVQYRNAVPAGYQFVGMGEYDDTVQSGEDNIILVANTGDHRISPVKEATASVLYEDIDHNYKVVGSASVKGNPGTKINYAQYEKAVPAGYQFVGMGEYDDTIQNGENNIILVAKNGEHRISPIKDVTANIFYEDVNDNNKVVGSASVKGIPGTKINYAQYEKAIPAGYQFVGMGEYDDTIQNGENNIILVAKNGDHHTPTPSTNTNTNNTKAIARVVYENAKTHQQIGDPVVISGPEGASIPYERYESENGGFMPNGYHFVDMGTYDPQLKNGDIDVINIDQNGSTYKQNTHTHTNNGIKHKGTVVRHHGTAPEFQHAGASASNMKNRVTNSQDFGTNNYGTSNYASGDYSNDESGYVNNNASLVSDISAPQVGNYSGIIGQQSNSKLPQTGEQANRAKEIAAALIALSAGIDALGVFVRRRHDND